MIRFALGRVAAFLGHAGASSVAAANWNGWSLYWALWLVLGFGVPEGLALATDPNNTLSDQVWHLEGTGATVGRYIVAAFLTWLWAHMVFRLFT